MPDAGDRFDTVDCAHPPRADSGPLPYWPALDGLRGVAVAAVLAFHGGFGWATGGYLGVSAFFTLSGFLITTLLLTEWRDDRADLASRVSGRRRLRRLMPAALLGLAGIVAFGALVADGDQLRELRGDVLAAMGYMANWRFIFSNQSYADLFAAPFTGAPFLVAGDRGAVLPLLPARGGGHAAAAPARRPTRRSPICSCWPRRARSRPGCCSCAPARAPTASTTAPTPACSSCWLVRCSQSASRASAFHGAEPSAADAWRRRAGAEWRWSACGRRWSQSDPWLHRGGLLVHAVLAAAVVLAAVQPHGPVRAVLARESIRRLGAHQLWRLRLPLARLPLARRGPHRPVAGCRSSSLRVAVTLAGRGPVVPPARAADPRGPAAHRVASLGVRAARPRGRCASPSWR